MRTKISNQTFVEWVCFSCGDVGLVAIISWSRGRKCANKQTFVKTTMRCFENMYICVYTTGRRRNFLFLSRKIGDSHVSISDFFFSARRKTRLKN